MRDAFFLSPFIYSVYTRLTHNSLQHLQQQQFYNEQIAKRDYSGHFVLLDNIK